jgi:biotin transport system substrate-specific component
MPKSATRILGSQGRMLDGVSQIAIVVGASLFVALCARVSRPLPFTPVPLTLQNFGVLLVGLTLGGRRGFAALILYLAEGLMGLPVFSPTGPGGVAQLLGPTGGFLLAYPFVAGIAGWIFETTIFETTILKSTIFKSKLLSAGTKTFARAAIACLLAEIYLFVGGLSWLAILTHSFAQAIRFGLYWFVFAEVIKIMSASALASGWQRFQKVQS